jgi:hypothetical protein
MLRDDSAMNLSPRMFRELVAPYDGRILAAVGGGAIHACGRTGHYLALATAIPGLAAFNFGQAEQNDPQTVAAATIGRGIPVIGLDERTWGHLAAGGVAASGLLHVA